MRGYSSCKKLRCAFLRYYIVLKLGFSPLLEQPVAMILPKSWLTNMDPATPALLLEGTANQIKFQSSQGFEIRSPVLRLTPQSVTFELNSPDSFLRLSEVLDEFKIFAGDREVYDGKATVTSMVNSGTAVVCEASLENVLFDVGLFQLGEPEKILPAAFKAFMDRWQTFYKILPEYKLVIADLQSLLQELRFWLDQLELGLSESPDDRLKIERAILQELPANPIIYALFERFERVAASIPEELVAAHRAFGQRQLHPLLLCAPFIYRTYAKPMGYAGDYEMMNMIVRNELEGKSLYAKLINAYLLAQVGPQAVRNRVGFLQGKIVDETSRVIRLGRTAKIYCIACGPAWEAQNFLAQSPLADHAEFRLLDFNEETLEHAGKKMDELRRKHNRRTSIKLVKNSVQNLLRDKGKAGSEKTRYDLIYCSGLYDYLNDRVIKALNTYLYDQLLPGGLLVVGNFAPCMPVRNFIEHFLEWFLIYRDGKQLAALAPEQASPDDCKVVAEMTGANIFLEVRKPQ